LSGIFHVGSKDTLDTGDLLLGIRHDVEIEIHTGGRYRQCHTGLRDIEGGGHVCDQVLLCFRTKI